MVDAKICKRSEALQCMSFLGHNDVKTTMIYTPVLNSAPIVVRSPVDGL